MNRVKQWKNFNLNQKIKKVSRKQEWSAYMCDALRLDDLKLKMFVTDKKMNV